MTNQPLIEFIKTQIQLGMTRDAITAMLLSQGWTSMDIDEAFVTINTAAVLPPVPISHDAVAVPVSRDSSLFHKGRSFLIILIILIVLCLGVGGAFAYYQYVQKNSPTQKVK